MSKRRFLKFHGLGNDFLLVDGRSYCPTIEEVVSLCDRHRGVGADGVLVLTPLDGKSKLEMRIFNRDGSRPEMCGNGVRCAAAYARMRWGFGEEILVESDAGPRACRINSQEGTTWQVSVDMGTAEVAANPVELEVDTDVDTESYEVLPVDVGNPHGVVWSYPSLEAIDRAGQEANQDHQSFPNGVNLEFVRPMEGGLGLEVVVYERGVGRTRACGTGACAVAAAYFQREPAETEAVDVHLPGGVLQIRRVQERLWMTGEAALVFAGEWLIDDEEAMDYDTDVKEL